MEDKYDLKNILETRETFPKCLTMRSFIFIDGKNRESTRFLKKHGVKNIKVWDVLTYVPNPNYRAVFCDVSKKEIDKLVEAMHDLDISMPILGYKEYDEVCSEFMKAALDLDR